MRDDASRVGAFTASGRSSGSNFGGFFRSRTAGQLASRFDVTPRPGTPDRCGRLSRLGVQTSRTRPSGADARSAGKDNGRDVDPSDLRLCGAPGGRWRCRNGGGIPRVPARELAHRRQQASLTCRRYARLRPRFLVGVRSCRTADRIPAGECGLLSHAPTLWFDWRSQQSGETRFGAGGQVIATRLHRQLSSTV